MLKPCFADRECIAEGLTTSAEIAAHFGVPPEMIQGRLLCARTICDRVARAF